MSGVKQCRDCGEVKGIGEFYLNKGLPQNPCKSCICKKRRAEYVENPGKIKDINSRSYLKNREKRLEAMAQYRLENKDAISQVKKDWWRAHRHTKLIDRRKKWRENREENLMISKQWREKNKEWVKNYNREYGKNNRDRIKGVKRLYYLQNKDKLTQKAYEWREINSEVYKRWKHEWQTNHRKNNRDYYTAKQQKRRAREKRSRGFYTADQIKIMYLSQKGLCNACGVGLHNKYHHDHIIPLAKGGVNTIENIQLLCPSCNLKKGVMDNDKFIEKIRGVNFG